MKRLQIPQKFLYEKFYVHEKILRTQNCHRNFIKNVLIRTRNKNMQSKQARFKSRLNYFCRKKFLTHISFYISKELKKTNIYTVTEIMPAVKKVSVIKKVIEPFSELLQNYFRCRLSFLSFRLDSVLSSIKKNEKDIHM